MKSENTHILTEISRLTRTIEDKYPELQKYLDESRSTLPKNDIENGKMRTEDLKNYRNSLRELIENYDKQKA